MRKSKFALLVTLCSSIQFVNCQTSYQNSGQFFSERSLSGDSMHFSGFKRSIPQQDFKISYTDSLNSNIRVIRPLGLSLYGGSPAIITSVSLDYYITPTFSIDAGGGLFGVYTGFRFHLMGNQDFRKWTPNTGLLFAVYGEAVGVDYLFFIPVGMNYTGPQGFNFAPEILIILDEFGPAVYPVWFGVKVGYRFSRF